MADALLTLRSRLDLSDLLCTLKYSRSGLPVSYTLREPICATRVDFASPSELRSTLESALVSRLIPWPSHPSSLQPLHYCHIPRSYSRDRWTLGMHNPARVFAEEAVLSCQPDVVVRSVFLLRIWTKLLYGSCAKYHSRRATLPPLKCELQAHVTELHKGNTSVSALGDQISDALSQTLASINLNAAATTKATTEVRNTMTKHNDDLVRSRQTEKDVAVIERILDSLYFPTMNARRNMSSLEHAEGTFDWVFNDESDPDDTDIHGSGLSTKQTSWKSDDESREDWDDQNSAASYTSCAATSRALELWLKSTDQQLFWISSNAGTGKSTLVHYLIDRVAPPPILEMLRRGDEQPLVLSVYIWASGDGMQRTMQGVLCALLPQVMSFDHTTSKDTSWIESSWSTKKSPADWSEPELRQTFATGLQRRWQLRPAAQADVVISRFPDYFQYPFSSQTAWTPAHEPTQGCMQRLPYAHRELKTLE
ncbi:uncharacterized protein B0I36DRAFT_352800 [Microdochium trichocladiopsis]|uniref:Nephrocystin 3-like N-terminal domain-containing protein n=1 Tax=Microdochium trichocladiopsis TaxID=1682393 RepID=A0A9P9BPI5_9PEZI|nr:uncharacterized protein B0I36DRAFT_352800 [Microdochium trichocladiopsis]KAH7024581.1 hypothetical protein B0I36DRAFT_352800 [Microdochium trichocladiopsis]